MKTNDYWLLASLLIGIIHSASAEVVLDGTLGPSGALPGPDYQIEAGAGQQQGPNLFHSFQTFNLNPRESATFSGPPETERIISRVTGGAFSKIDGLLRVDDTAPNADFYLLNPAGVLFGSNARLDVPGAFLVSTADFLKMGESGRFDARLPGQSRLTMDAPISFGFLDMPRGEIRQNGAELQVTPGERLSFIGGNLDFQDSRAIAKGGRIDLISVASAGEVPAESDSPALDAFSRLGNIRIADSTKGTANKERFVANIHAAGLEKSVEHSGGGRIFIRGGEVLLDNGYVFADTVGSEHGQEIEVRAQTLNL
ncbi:MAG: filamentous hemagglutinin N-terminal domain-containing protein, partial [Gammaproteobacteria bacterium]|nr:filamentous hemagglutinin N-terminal domain-containing protein [Gammaproteobacteria bacterium]